jgi:hypothetical protein
MEIEENIPKVRLYTVTDDGTLEPVQSADGKILIDIDASDIVATPDIIITGRLENAVPGTELPLASESTMVRKVYIQALSDNVGSVVIGDSNVVAAEATRRGYKLEADDPFFIELADLNDIYIDAENAGDGISFIATAMSS